MHEIKQIYMYMIEINLFYHKKNNSNFLEKLDSRHKNRYRKQEQHMFFHKNQGYRIYVVLCVWCGFWPC